MLKSYIASVGILLLAGAPVARAQDMTYQNSDSTLVVTGDVGLMWIKADEYVFMGPDTNDRLSYLKWESAAVPVFNGTARLELPGRFLIKGTVEIGTGGDGYMEDYDWISPFATGTGANDWSDRSQHDATKLDHFYGGSIALGYQLIEREAFSLDILGGAQYRDVKWSAYGGDYIYSYFRRHDTVGSWPDDEIGISYRQKIPAAFAGLDFTYTSGRWTISGSAKGGFTIGATAIDDHWQRPLFFTEEIDVGPTLALSANVAYALNDRFRLNVGAAYDQTFKARSDSETFDPIAGRTYYSYGDTGAGQRSFTVTAGLTGRF